MACKSKLKSAGTAVIGDERLALRREELCSMLGITTETLRAWHEKNVGPPGRFKIGKAKCAPVFYDRAAVLDWMKHNIAAASSAAE